MATPVIMPRQGQSVESCIIAKWHKRKGDKVEPGEVLFTYETDKAVFDEEAKVGGTVLEIFFVEGDEVPVLTNICVIGEVGEDTAEFDPRVRTAPEKKGGEQKVPEPAGPAPKDTPPKVSARGQGEGTPVQAQAAGDNKNQPPRQELKISPRARNLAARMGVDYRSATPTGPYGRIIERDIIALPETGPMVTPAAREEYLASASGRQISGTGLGGRITTADLAMASAPGEIPITAPAPEYEEVKLSNIRKVIAKAMHHSLTSTAQLTMNTSFDATEILAYRSKVKAEKDLLGLENITLNDMILYAVSRTLLKHRELNAHFLEDKMLLFNHVNLGVAVDTERGLMVPTVFSADLKSLSEISAEVKRLVQECQKGTINPDNLKGGSFTVTNLGALGIESFTPVLNPPQTGILGVNTIVQRAKEVDGELVYYPAIGLSLTFDHRAIDGAPAARFLQDLTAHLERFSLLLAK